MRLVMIRAAANQRAAVLAACRRQHAVNVASLPLDGGPDTGVLILASVGNARLDDLLAALNAESDLAITLIPRGVLALHPPPSAAPAQVTDVSRRSPIEIYLGGLQSIGSWWGFLGYAVGSTVVTWLGLLHETVYLLTAGMLIAPYAGPAMNVAIGAARGDGGLVLRSLLRFGSALLVAMATAWVLSALTGLTRVTPLMASTAQVSALAVVLPLTAGSLGALSLVQAERSSLVSGAAIGVLVASSLAPPAVLAGMAAWLGAWPLSVSGLFVLLLQVAGITVAAAAVFRWCGMRPDGPRYRAGMPWSFALVLGASGLALAGLLSWQHLGGPTLRRQTVAETAVDLATATVTGSGLARPIDAEAHFRPVDPPDWQTLLVHLDVEPQGSLTGGILERRLGQLVADRLRRTLPGVRPLVGVTILTPPAAPDRPATP